MRAALELAEAADVWHALPAEMAGTLRTEAAASVAEMTEAIRSEVTEYALPLDDTYASTLGRAVRHAVGTFIDRVEDPGTPMTAIVAEFREIGLAAAREGHGLEPLQAAMRLSARVGWRRLCRVAGEQGLDMLMLGHIGEAIFVYLDELAAASAGGYLDARSELADERARLRRKLLDMILAEPPAGADAIAGIAKAAGWALPRRVAVIALGDRPPGDAAGGAGAAGGRPHRLGPTGTVRAGTRPGRPRPPVPHRSGHARLGGRDGAGRPAGPGEHVAALGAGRAGAGRPGHH